MYINEFEEVLKQATIIVDKYIPSDKKFEVCITDFSFLLMNWKAQFVLTPDNGKVYEMTYDEEKNCVFLTAYVKDYQITVPSWSTVTNYGGSGGN